MQRIKGHDMHDANKSKSVHQRAHTDKQLKKSLRRVVKNRRKCKKDFGKGRTSYKAGKTKEIK